MIIMVILTIEVILLYSTTLIRLGHLQNDLSLFLSVSHSFRLSVLSICLSVYPFTDLSIYRSTCFAVAIILIFHRWNTSVASSLSTVCLPSLCPLSFLRSSPDSVFLCPLSVFLSLVLSSLYRPHLLRFAFKL